MTTGAAWSVTTQAETMGIGPAGTAVNGVKVGFKLADGTSGSVFVPEAQYTADNVKAMIAERVKAILAVKGLTG